jgi:5'-methylthioadenosine phosphorylase
MDTPFGKPSAPITLANWEQGGGGPGVPIAFLARHGVGHTIPPSAVPFRANIYALKAVGCRWIIASGAVGSLREEIAPRDLVLVDQFIDRTYRRIGTFFDEPGGGAVHVEFAEPVCPVLHGILKAAAAGAHLGVSRIHPQGTYVCMEGPAFSTRAESKMYRAWGADIIGMTALPEAKLAREAEICYAIIACVTDYDSWWDPGKPVDVATVIKTLNENIDMAKHIIKLAVKKLPEHPQCGCTHALDGAIVTAPEKIPAATKKKLGLIIEKYLK